MLRFERDMVDTETARAVLEEFRHLVALKQCYYNCAQIVQVTKGRFRYVEGFVSDGFVPGSYDHAWLIDPFGAIIDPTMALLNEVHDTREQDRPSYFPLHTYDHKQATQLLKKSVLSMGEYRFPLFIHEADLRIPYTNGDYRRAQIGSMIYGLLEYSNDLAMDNSVLEMLFSQWEED